MSHAVLCRLRADSANARKELRLDHLEYIRAHADAILAGGPTLNADESPNTMILLTRFESHEEARIFVADEPYNRSGRVFEEVEVFGWSQVLPQSEPGTLDREIVRERTVRTAG